MEMINKFVLISFFLFISCGKQKEKQNIFLINDIPNEYSVLGENFLADLKKAMNKIESKIIQVEITSENDKNIYYLSPIFDAAYLYDSRLRFHFINEVEEKILLIHFNGFNDFRVYNKKARLELIKRFMNESYQYFLENDDFPVPSTRHFKVRRVDLNKEIFDSIPKWYNLNH